MRKDQRTLENDLHFGRIFSYPHIFFTVSLTSVSCFILFSPFVGFRPAHFGSSNCDSSDVQFTVLPKIDCAQWKWSTKRRTAPFVRLPESKFENIQILLIVSDG